IDFISGGAITHCLLYCVARIPGVTATGRIIEPDTAELSNLNRYMLLLRSDGEVLKALHLCETLPSGLLFKPVYQKYDSNLLEKITPLASIVAVGVDHIPTRWAVQEARPDWLLIGATGHWSAMVSFHSD